jgi:hypothetical protein
MPSLILNSFHDVVLPAICHMHASQGAVSASGITAVWQPLT